MDRDGMVERELERKSKVHQRTINNILNAKTSTTIDVLDKVAAAFGLQGWQLLIENLPEKLSQGGTHNIGTIVERTKQHKT